MQCCSGFCSSANPATQGRCARARALYITAHSHDHHELDDDAAGVPTASNKLQDHGKINTAQTAVFDDMYLSLNTKRWPNTQLIIGLIAISNPKLIFTTQDCLLSFFRHET